MAEEVTKVGESYVAASSLAEESRTDETNAEIDVAMGMAGEERHVLVGEAVQEPTASVIDIAMAESQKVRLSADAKQEVVEKAHHPLKRMKRDPLGL